MAKSIRMLSKQLNTCKLDNLLKSYTGDNYFLTVGRFSPTKNTLTIAKAFTNRSKIFKKYKLVIVGRKGWYEELNDYYDKYTQDDIVVFDFVSDQELLLLYRNAYCFISSSIYEGFGIPLIEANYCGCPRICCSDIPVYREVCNEINFNDAIYFDPFNVNDLKNKLFKQYNIINSNYHMERNCMIDKAIIQFQGMLNTVL
jgi:glycosyltransferase involved in cell wall biosynthesis